MTDTPDPQNPPNIHRLRNSLEDPPVAAGPKNADKPPEGPQRRSTGPKLAADLARRDHGEIWPDCPVRALGVHGEVFFYLDWLGQLQPVNGHTKDRMRGIFGGRSDLLQDWFPQINKGGQVSGWSQEDAATHMMRACAEKGVWNAFERVRGLGAWPDDEGGVILHCGDRILYKGAWKEPGEIDGYVYPSAIKVPRPADEFAGSAPAQELLAALGTWAWLRDDVDAYLLLGWICGAIFGGAMDWRALVWITGDAGTGKSSLQKLIRNVMGGEGAILQSTDATEASVRQFLMQSTVPVALDEIEAEADNRKIHSVIKLARQAASGGVILRGGADHKGQEFKARSAFLFSSILVPPLLDQDISRIALLELMPLARGATAPDPNPKKWAKIGRQLRARVIDNWDRLHATLEAYRAALSRAGHSARGCDQFGTLLAMADLALSDDMPSTERCDLWAEKLSAAIIEDQTNQSADWQRCLDHLLSQQVDMLRGGERRTVGRWVMIAAGIDDSDEVERAQRSLGAIGLRVYGRRDAAQLAVANVHSGLAELFQGTHWYTTGGKAGVWVQSMKRVPGAEKCNTRFDLKGSRAWRFPLRALPGFSAEKDLLDAPHQAPHSAFDPNDLT